MDKLDCTMSLHAEQPEMDLPQKVESIADKIDGMPFVSDSDPALLEDQDSFVRDLTNLKIIRMTKVMISSWKTARPLMNRQMNMTKCSIS